jgi:hypothetical protein
MAKPTVYIETTIVSYLTAWPSRDVVRLSHELLTRDWWKDERPKFDLFTSELVIRESSAGDPTAAAERLKSLGAVMTEDPIVTEVRRWREQYAAQFDFDLAAMFDDLRRGTEEAKQAGRTVVALPPRRAQVPTPPSGNKAG